jgi:hypothetical protein
MHRPLPYGHNAAAPMVQKRPFHGLYQVGHGERVGVRDVVLLEKRQDDFPAVHRATRGPEGFDGEPEQRAVREPGIGLAPVSDRDARFQQSDDGLDVPDIDPQARALRLERFSLRVRSR